MFANMYMAYETLSPKMQAFLDALEGVHDVRLEKLRPAAPIGSNLTGKLLPERGSSLNWQQLQFFQCRRSVRMISRPGAGIDHFPVRVPGRIAQKRNDHGKAE